jgi:hypothetical protein
LKALASFELFVLRHASLEVAPRCQVGKVGKTNDTVLVLLEHRVNSLTEFYTAGLINVTRACSAKLIEANASLLVRALDFYH